MLETIDGLAVAEHCLDELLDKGFVVVPGWLTDDEVAAGRESFATLVPTPEEYFELGEAKFAALQDAPPNVFGAKGLVRYPRFDSDVLLDHLVGGRLLRLMEHVLGSDDVRVGELGFFAKYAGLLEYDQALHLDGMTMAYPRDDRAFWSLSTWLYYSDVGEQDGPTHLLPREHARTLAPGVGQVLREEPASGPAPNQAVRPDLYEHEVAATGPAGSLLIWINPGIYHRGAALGPPPAYRWITGTGYHHAQHGWFGQGPWATNPGQPAIRRFLTRATPEQRTAIGFPPPGHAFWDDRTLAGVAAHYPGIDLEPYRPAG
jgi:hypothetical protein